jgi:predicted esterase
MTAVLAAASGAARAVVRAARPAPAVALLAALLLAACGGSDDPPAPAPGPIAAVPAPPSSVLGTTQVAPDPAWLGATRPVAVLGKATIEAANQRRGWAALTGPARCDVTVHAISHATVGPKGEPTDATGAVLVPSGPDCPGPYTIVSYSRGTDLHRSRTLAVPDDRETQAIAGFFATHGLVVVASDYLGYGGSSLRYHPYLQAESVARTNLDAIRASRTLLSRLGVAESGRLILTGYSQGGHAALATQRAIERDRPAGFALTATGAMSGPYDLAGTLTDSAALLTMSFASLDDSPLERTVELRLGDLIAGSLADLLANGSSVGQYLSVNSVLGWTPVAPVLLCGGSRDPVVTFANTVNAAADFASRGARVAVLDVEQVPAFRPLLPPAGTPSSELGTYHQGTVPPLCFQMVRDRVLAVYR